MGCLASVLVQLGPEILLVDFEASSEENVDAGKERGMWLLAFLAVVQALFPY